MERKIGEIFKHNDEWYQCIEGEECSNCYFNNKKCYILRDNDNNDPIGNCCIDRRTDNKDVIFKKLEKVGEPYIHNSIMVQKYKLYSRHVIMPDRPFIRFDLSEDTIEIEIKQNQEDMEEKKLNLKPFDLEAAKAGKPVCTRDGRKARIICFDKKDEDNIYPIVCLVQDGETESLGIFMKDGHSLVDVEETPSDLMMLPEKKEGWAVIYKDDLLRTEKEAWELAEQSISEVIRIEKIEWEE